MWGTVYLLPGVSVGLSPRLWPLGMSPVGRDCEPCLTLLEHREVGAGSHGHMAPVVQLGQPCFLLALP